MPPRRLTVEEENYVKYWSQKAIYFMGNIRKANCYLLTVPRAVYVAAYKEYTASGDVVGGDWENLDRNDRRRWEPEPEEREVYFEYMEDRIKKHPLISPLNAVKVVFAGNAGVMCINRLVAMDRPGRVQTAYWAEYCRLNQENFLAVYGPPESRPGRTKDVIVRDPDEDHNQKLFARSRSHPRDPVHKLSPSTWKQHESVGETYFFRDGDDTTEFSALQLTGILILATGTFYNIRFEETTDSIRMSEQELLGLIEDGFWL